MMSTSLGNETNPVCDPTGRRGSHEQSCVVSDDETRLETARERAPSNFVNNHRRHAGSDNDSTVRHLGGHRTVRIVTFR